MCSDFRRIEGPGHYSIHERPHKENNHAPQRPPTAGPGRIILWSQPSQQECSVKKSLSRRDLWVQHLFNSVNTNTFHRSPRKFLRKLYPQIHHWLGLKGTRTGHNEKWQLGLQNSTGGSKLRKLFSYIFSMKKGRMTQRVEQ